MSGLSLCLSGGGHRAALYHLGALARLNEYGVLSRVTAVSSVSGGSIIAGLLARAWPGLRLDPSTGRFDNFDAMLSRPLRSYIDLDLRDEVILKGQLRPEVWRGKKTITELFAEKLDQVLFNGMTLQELPETPDFTFCATNLETAVCWRYSRRRSGDYQVGWMDGLELPLCRAVAASAAFPMAFPPIVEHFPPGQFRGGALEKRGQEHLTELRESVSLTDGGVYDNLGLEPLWKTSDALLISDGGKPLNVAVNPDGGIMNRLLLASSISANQQEALRKRVLLARFKGMSSEEFPPLRGTYWGPGSNFRQYPRWLDEGYEGPVLEAITGIRTDLNAFAKGETAILVNHGYLLADTALRSWLDDGSLYQTAPTFTWPAATNRPGDPANRTALAESAKRVVWGPIHI